MKVFFHAQLRDLENYFVFYRLIYNTISELGYQHTYNIFNVKDSRKISNRPDSFENSKKADQYTNLIKNIKLSDIIVVEISLHSFTSGFLMHEALIDGKPVIALYLESNDSFYMTNMHYERLQFVEYNSSNIRGRLEKAFELAKKQIDVRFNFFISPDIISYLNYISSEFHISKSTYIRDLIIKDIKKNKHYTRKKQ